MQNTTAASLSPYQSAITDGRRDEQRHIAKTWAAIQKRKWIIVGCVAVALLVGLLITLLSTRYYTANATLEIQRETRNFTNVDSAQRQDQSYDLEFYQTQYGLLRSRSLADQVSAALKLPDDPQFFRTFRVRAADRWFASSQAIVASRADRQKVASDILLPSVTVTPERNSRLVTVSFTSPDPQLSKRIVDTWTQQFIKSSLDRRFQATSYARGYLETRLQQLRNRMDTSERQLVEYSAQHQILSVPSGGAPAEGDSAAVGTGRDVPIVATDLAALNSELSRATAARIVAESRLNGGGLVPAEALDNAAITTLRTRRAELSADYAKLIQQFEPQYAGARAVKSEINQLDRSIASEEGRVRSSIQDVYRASVARETDLQSHVGALKASLLDLRRRSIQYDILQRDVDTSRQLYAALLQRYKEIGVAGGVGVNNVSVVDDAELPVKPSSPVLALNLGLSLLLGLLAGGAAVFLLEMLDFGISDPADVPAELGLPLLGTVPKVAGGAGGTALSDPKSALYEAYVSLRTRMSLSTDHGFPRTLMLTSARPGEGKSTTSLALARTLAQVGRQTVLIDADMRSPSVAKMTGAKGAVGLSTYLSGGSEVRQLLQEVEPNLYVIAAGVQPPSATELLASERLPALLEILTRDFAHVVIDAPPVMGIADALLLASHVEGVVFVVEAHATTRSQASVALDRLFGTKANLLGVLLTKFNPRNATSGYSYQYGYGYEYGLPSGETVASGTRQAR